MKKTQHRLMQRTAQTRRDDAKEIETFPARRGFRPTNQGIHDPPITSHLSPLTRCPLSQEDQATDYGVGVGLPCLPSPFPPPSFP